MFTQNKGQLLVCAVLCLFTPITSVTYALLFAKPEAPCQQAAIRAEASLAEADRAFRKGNFRAANTMLDAALGILGDSYSRDDFLDDTGMHLLVADMKSEKGNLKDASTIKRRMLESRIEMCEFRSTHPPQHLPRDDHAHDLVRPLKDPVHP